MSNIAMGIKQAMLSKGVRQKFVAERAGFTSQQFTVLYMMTLFLCSDTNGLQIR